MQMRIQQNIYVFIRLKETSPHIAAIQTFSSVFYLLIEKDPNSRRVF